MNRLSQEKSPYLLQHAGNPVDWYPWGREAFERAQREDRPVFLSIGYSTCHWCHVMAHESFEDPEVARLLNETFVCVKVDREERPDVDHLYMQACQMMTGGGGWPMSMFLTPGKRPFHAATYIPKHSRFGRLGLLELVPLIRRLWQAERGRIEETAAQVIGALQAYALQERAPRTGAPPAPAERAEAGRPAGEPGEQALAAAHRQLAAEFDGERGGFGREPKFPNPSALAFLLRRWKRSGDAQALRMVEKTLAAMREGGIYDQLGFGFHRYSTDAEWKLPHFEKMLYDQAQLALVYVEAWQATGRPEYRRTAEEVLGYCLRELAHPEGGFYSAVDADSEGEEGKFYLWTQEQIERALDPRAAGLVRRRFGIRPQGNFADPVGGGAGAADGAGGSANSQAKPSSPSAKGGGRNVLHAAATVEEAARGEGLAPQEAQRLLEESLRRLYEARESRPHPGRDEKILTDWNGLMIAALARAAAAFDRPDLGEAARRALEFLLGRARLPGVADDGVADAAGRGGPPDSRPAPAGASPGVADAAAADDAFEDGTGELAHRWREGEAAVPAQAADYAFLTWGVLELYGLTLEARYLKLALRLNARLLAGFQDMEGGGFYLDADRGDLPVRSKEVYDGALPSANSVALFNLLRLARLTGEAELEEAAARTARAFSGAVRRSPAGCTHFLSALDFALGPAAELVIVGDPGREDTRELIGRVRGRFLPGLVLLLKPAADAARRRGRAPGAGGGEAAELEKLAPYTRGLTAPGGRATAYVCRDFACALPTTDGRRMLELLEDPPIPR